ncbi:hypothetical protein [Bizionia arctica]|uniref:YtxH domain-containing protein n=1 Tax=Bizionia arctica TaxID=1495645 RepID=A0A917LNW6_9FLAO|nr:hypothetical protein [Bizionia arctica]GGG48154.1 hypothetical protein GCM10010976_19420 [Bizionia arctica]
MKKILLIFAVLFSLSTVFMGCREEKKADNQVEKTLDDVGDDIEDVADDVGDGIENAADEVEDVFDGN